MIFCQILSAQSTSNERIFFDKDWNRVKNKSDASYFRIISFKDSDYKKQYPVGWVKDFYIEGNIQWKGKFSYYDYNNEEHNKGTGLITWYHKNGQKSRESYFNDGVIYGETSYWNKRGYLETVVNYKNGEINGEATVYFEDGSISRVIDYEYGKENGYDRQYYENGDLKSIRRYENGVQADKYVIEFDEYGDCQMVAKDEFRDNSNNWRIDVTDVSSYSLDTVNGEYSIVSKVDNGYIKWVYTHFGVNEGFDPLAFAISDYVVEARLKKVSRGGQGSYGFFFGVKNSDNYMYLNIRETESKVSCKVHSMEDGVRENLSEWEEIEYFNRNSYNKFQIRQSINFDKKGNFESVTFNVIVNGYRVMQSDVSILKGFNFGFGVSGNNTRVSTDYLNIRYPCKEDYKGVKNESCGGSGSGFAINKKGYIATNYHVVKECEDIFVKGLYGDTVSYKAQVILKDPANDLAILKVDNWIGLLPYGFNRVELDPLEDVYAYGYPRSDLLGERIKATDGTISSTSATADDDIRYYQHTAAIQPGSSGGPLFDKNGNVVAINTLSWSKLDLDNTHASVKVSYLIKHMKDLDIEIPSNNSLKFLDKTKQYKQIKSYVYKIIVK